MDRCPRIYGLEVHHKRRDGGNDLSNAQVLCEDCHAATETYGTSAASPPPFSAETKESALWRAGRRCECTSNRGCH
jgi:5-methylcytosine-specific restriction endonuclease McrA